MLFIETPLFTKQVQKLLDDERYRVLQSSLIIRPDAGELIKGSGGLRKIRWAIPGKGKRGGLRVIYYWDKPVDKIYMLWTYKKSKKEDLTQGQIKLLRGLVKEWLK